MKNIQIITDSVKSATDEQILMCILPLVRKSKTPELVKAVIYSIIESELLSRGIPMKVVA